VRPLDAMPMTTSFFARFAPGHLVATLPGVILVTSESEAKALRPPGDDELDAIDVKRGRTLRRIKSGNAAAGAGSHVDESPAALQGGGSEINSASNLR